MIDFITKKKPVQALAPLRGNKLLSLALSIIIALTAFNLMVVPSFALGDNSAPSYGQLTDMKFGSVSVGEKWGLAVDSLDRVWVWGWNGRGQLGSGGANGHITQPYAGGIQLVTGLPAVKQAAAGQSHGLAADYNGDVWMWGYCGSSQVIPWNATLAVNTPAKLNRELYGMGKIVKVGGGQEYSAALDENGAMLVWGQDLYGQHGDGAVLSTAPSKVIFPEDDIKIVDFEAGFAHILALDDKGELWVWGHNTYGECARVSAVLVQNTPVRVTKPAEMGNVADFDATSRTNMVLDDKGQVWHWGQIWGNLNYANYKVVYSPALLSFNYTKNNPDYSPLYEFPGAASVHAGGKTNYIIDNDGKIWAYGTNGGYGFGTVSDYYIADSEITAEGLTGRWGYSEEAFRTPVITGNGDQDILGGQLDRLAYFHPQVEGSVRDPKANYNNSNPYPEGYWKHYNIGIKKELSEITVPYAAQIASYAKPDLTADAVTVILDIDGNLWIWGYTSDGQIAWGYENVRDLDTNGFQNPNVPKGLWDYYMYEPALMRGVPGGDKPGERTDPTKIEFSRDYTKIYKGTGGRDSVYASVTLPQPREIEFGSITLNSVILDIKHVVIYDQNSPLYTKSPEQITAAEFSAAYSSAAQADRGSTGEIRYTGAGEEYSDKLRLAEIKENCRVLIFAEGEGLYEPFTAFEAFTFDNFYTPLKLFERGVDIEDEENIIYGPGQEKVVKVYPGEFDIINHSGDPANYQDKEQKIYGIPLYRDGTVIPSPYFLFDEVSIKEALPAQLQSLWEFSALLPDGSPQSPEALYKLNPGYADSHPGYMSENSETATNANTHTFYYISTPEDIVSVHLRYIVVNPKPDLPILPGGYLTLERIAGALRFDGGSWTGEINKDGLYGQRVVTYAQDAVNIPEYTSFHLRRSGIYNGFLINPVIPVNYKYVDTGVSETGGDNEIFFDNAFLYFREGINELWATIRITPSAEGPEQPYSVDEVINSVGEIKKPGITK